MHQKLLFDGGVSCEKQGIKSFRNYFPVTRFNVSKSEVQSNYNNPSEIYENQKYIL